MLYLGVIVIGLLIYMGDHMIIDGKTFKEEREMVLKDRA